MKIRNSKKIENTISGRANGINFTFVTRTISNKEYNNLGDTIEADPLTKWQLKVIGTMEHFDE